jgi:hypothetical protein
MVKKTRPEEKNIALGILEITNNTPQGMKTRNIYYFYSISVLADNVAE